MTRMFRKTNKLDYCPHKVYKTILTGEYGLPVTDAMEKGSFFEERVLGRGRNEHKKTVLKKLKDGKPTIDEVRILEQVEMFPVIVEHYGMIVKDQKIKNVQIPVSKPAVSVAYPNIKIFLTGTIDFISPINAGRYNFDAAVFDLKLTMDRNSEHGAYSWGRPQYLDVIQIVHYSELTGLPGFYLVFDYKAKSKNSRNVTSNGHKLLPVMTMPMVEALNIPYDSKDYNTAKTRKQDWKLTIKETIEEIVKMHNIGYPHEPSYEECNSCPLNPINNPRGECKYANAIQRI